MELSIISPSLFYGWKVDSILEIKYILESFSLIEAKVNCFSSEGRNTATHNYFENLPQVHLLGCNSTLKISIIFSDYSNTFFPEILYSALNITITQTIQIVPTPNNFRKFSENSKPKLHT